LPETHCCSDVDANHTQTPILVFDSCGNLLATGREATPANDTAGLHRCETMPPGPVEVTMDFLQKANPFAQFPLLSGLTDTQNGETLLVRQPQHGIIPTCAPSNTTSVTAVPSSTAPGATHNRGVKRRKKGEQPQELEFACSLFDITTTPNRWFRLSNGILTELVKAGWIITAWTPGELKSGATPVHVLFAKQMVWTSHCETVHVRSLLALFEALLLHMSCKESGAETHAAHVDCIIKIFMYEQFAAKTAAQFLANRQSHWDDSDRPIRFRAMDRKSCYTLVNGILSNVVQ